MFLSGAMILYTHSEHPSILDNEGLQLIMRKYLSTVSVRIQCICHGQTKRVNRTIRHPDSPD